MKPENASSYLTRETKRLSTQNRPPNRRAPRKRRPKINQRTRQLLSELKSDILRLRIFNKTISYGIHIILSG